MIDDIKRGKINCVITKDLSRLGRNYIQVGYYQEEFFPSHNVRYIAINDNVDSNNDNNDFCRSIQKCNK
ncbi:MAG: recombinase family protein [Clostridium sp.]|nr:MAG: recombinase family protein [Clostridium sp.]